MSGIAFALLAGLLSTLSPCVLPLVPIVLGTALEGHRYGPVALSAGLAISYVVIGLFVATIGFSVGLNEDIFRSAAATVMIIVGGVLLIPRIQWRLASAAGPIGNWTQSRAATLSHQGLGGQFGIGLLLGAAWSPCVGPTLGAASVLAARAENLPLVAVTMMAFGIGAALPLLAIGMMSRDLLARWRHRMMSAGAAGKAVMGVTLVAIGLLVLTGMDKRIETVLVDASPAWLTDLTTRF